MCRLDSISAWACAASWAAKLRYTTGRTAPDASKGHTRSRKARAMAPLKAVERARKRYEAEGGKDERMLSDLHFHDLRHIAVTALAEKLPNIVELAAVSGHQDVRMLRRYYHPKAEDLARKLG